MDSFNNRSGDGLLSIEQEGDEKMRGELDFLYDPTYRNRALRYNGSASYQKGFIATKMNLSY